MMVLWGDNMCVQIKNVQDNFYYFFKYYNHEVKHIKDFLLNREKTYEEYLKFKNKLEAKKEKLYNSMDVNRWEIPQKILQDLNIPELKTNKQLAFKTMLPKVFNA